jgi:hypothetical protein
MQRKKQKMVLLMLAAMGFGLFLSQSQGQAASTRADVPAEMPAEEAADKAGNVCTPSYCARYPQVCKLAGCPNY